MQYFVSITFFLIFNLTHLSVSYHRNYNKPSSGDWEPKGSMAPPVVEVNYSVVVAPLAQGGALHWDAAENVLFFADVKEQTLYRYDPATKVHKYIKLGAPVSLVIPIKGQKHHTVLSQSGELVILRWYWDSGNFSTSYLTSVGSPKIQSHWGSGRADVYGRIWAESVTFGDRKLGVKVTSTLYVIDTITSCRIDSRFSDQDLSSGLAWSPDNTVLYYSTLSRKIEAFDFNIESGSIGSSRVVFDYGDLPGSPAGLAVNRDGDLWIASLGGSQIIKINPISGKLLKQIKLPLKQVNSIVFGGPTLEDLYVASAETEDTDESGLQGAVIKIIDLKETGVPMYPTDILCKPCNDKVDADSSSWWCTASNE